MLQGSLRSSHFHSLLAKRESREGMGRKEAKNKNIYMGALFGTVPSRDSLLAKRTTETTATRAGHKAVSEHACIA